VPTPPPCAPATGPADVPQIRYQACRAKSPNGRAAPGHGFSSERPVQPGQGRSEQRRAGCHGEEASRRVQPFDAKMSFALADDQRCVAPTGDKGDSCARRRPTLGGAARLAELPVSARRRDLALRPVRAAVAVPPATAPFHRHRARGHLGVQGRARHNLQLWEWSMRAYGAGVPARGRWRADVTARCLRAVPDGALGQACEKCHTTVSFKQGPASQ
jgi:hypothetical protein